MGGGDKGDYPSPHRPPGPRRAPGDPLRLEDPVSFPLPSPARRDAGEPGELRKALFTSPASSLPIKPAAGARPQPGRRGRRRGQSGEPGPAHTASHGAAGRRAGGAPGAAGDVPAVRGPLRGPGATGLRAQLLPRVPGPPLGGRAGARPRGAPRLPPLRPALPAPQPALARAPGGGGAHQPRAAGAPGRAGGPRPEAPRRPHPHHGQPGPAGGGEAAARRAGRGEGWSGGRREAGRLSRAGGGRSEGLPGEARGDLGGGCRSQSPAVAGRVVCCCCRDSSQAAGGQGGGTWRSGRGLGSPSPASSPTRGRAPPGPQSAPSPCESPASPQQPSRLGPRPAPFAVQADRTPWLRCSWHNWAAFPPPLRCPGAGRGGSPVSCRASWDRPAASLARDHRPQSKGPINALSFMAGVKQLYWEALKREPLPPGLRCVWSVMVVKGHTLRKGQAGTEALGTGQDSAWWR